nr:hypothetical protein [Mycoplasmopsis bovis]
MWWDQRRKETQRPRTKIQAQIHRGLKKTQGDKPSLKTQDTDTPTNPDQGKQAEPRTRNTQNKTPGQSKTPMAKTRGRLRPTNPLVRLNTNLKSLMKRFEKKLNKDKRFTKQ